MHETKVSVMKGEKFLHFEIMRVLAIFFVIHTHTEYNGYYLFSRYPDSSFSFWIYLFISIFGAFAVPLFFAVSGALMLNRPEESLKKLWLKRIVRYGCLLVSVCFLYYFQANAFQFSEVNLKEFIIILYSYSSGSITWFLYSYLAYLILLPVLRVLAQNLKNAHFYYVFAIVLLYKGVIPVLEYAVFQGTQTLNPSFTVGWIAETIVIYPLLGYFLEHRLEKKKCSRLMGYLWISNIATILLSCAMTVYKGRITGEYAEGVSSTFFTSFVLINCATVYLTVSRLASEIRCPDWLRKGFFSLGQCTLGIYALHLFLMKLPFSDGIREAILSLGMNPMVASMLFCVYILLVSYGSTLVLKKIPVLKKLL